MKNFKMIFDDVHNLSQVPFKGQSLAKELNSVQGNRVSKKVKITSGMPRRGPMDLPPHQITS